MSGWLIAFFSLLLLMVIIIGAVFFSWYIMEFAKKLRLERVKRNLSDKLRYHCYYLKEQDIKKDERAQKLVSISHHGYIERSFEDYYQRLTEEHLPIVVLINWTRTIVEDLQNAVSPISHAQRWNDFFHSKVYRDYSDMSVHPDFVHVLDDHELAYLWGAVYYWLKCLSEGFENMDLLQAIENIACRKMFLRPYFYHFKNIADGNCDESSLMLAGVGAEKNNLNRLDAGPTCCLLLGVANMTEDMVNKTALEPVVAKMTGGSEKYIHTIIMGALKSKHKESAAKMVESAMPNLAEKIRKL